MCEPALTKHSAGWAEDWEGRADRPRRSQA